MFSAAPVRIFLTDLLYGSGNPEHIVVFGSSGEDIGIPALAVHICCGENRDISEGAGGRRGRRFLSKGNAEEEYNAEKKRKQLAWQKKYPLTVNIW